MARRQAVLMRTVRRSQSPKDKKYNHRKKGGIFLEIGILYFFTALLIGIIFFECTKTGQKIADYIIKKIMK